LVRRAEDRAEQLEVLVKIIVRADIVNDVIQLIQPLDVGRYVPPRLMDQDGYYQASSKTVKWQSVAIVIEEKAA
jgi:hypothetical protein